jgi:hypothetical protein
LQSWPRNPHSNRRTPASPRSQASLKQGTQRSSTKRPTTSLAHLGGGFEIPRGELVPDRIEDNFRLRIAGLPQGTRLLLLAAAAEPLGDPGLLRAVASRLGLDERAADEAEAEGLIRVGERVAFRHPLVRSAVYHGAPGEDRRVVHRALAEVTDPQADPDRRAWHRAEAAAGADEEIAADLERSAERAHERGGLAAEAAFLERAVSLTPDRGRRAARAVAAALAKLAAGVPGTAGQLMQIARQGPLRPADLAHLELLEARALLLTQSQDGVPERLLRAARGLAPFEPALSREIYLQAIEAAMYAGHLGPEDGLRNAAQAARFAPRAAQPPRPVDLLLDGMVTRFTADGAAGALALQRAFAAFLDQADSPIPAVAMFAALGTWDDEAWGLLVERTAAGVDRRSGNLVGVLSVGSRPRSASSPAPGSPPGRSPPSCSSAPGPSSTTCRTSSPNSASPPAPSSRAPGTDANRRTYRDCGFYGYEQHRIAGVHGHGRQHVHASARRGSRQLRARERGRRAGRADRHRPDRAQDPQRAGQ